ncbi:hypothetical protein ACFFX1_10180 [Dactylosporangium sucinum]|uniref:Uncharacterized protein n=1 Tax=Dactylosporangium sucinum TaxID=1424081 RepID=A0A917TI58_9ACTN|nr:hypothetical protein [Dactylosporangium sucinum]GGM24097.1 hypothetical protein GCM10007977_026560 [Dactylosporangium sucinum]
MTRTIQVRAFLNMAKDALGRPLGMLDGYATGHALALAFETTVMRSPEGDLAICEQVFCTLNVGDDPEFGTPDARAVAYRAQGHRSLSVGDVVAIDQRFYACARFGFKPIDPPAAGDLSAGTGPHRGPAPATPTRPATAATFPPLRQVSTDTAPAATTTASPQTSPQPHRLGR